MNFEIRKIAVVYITTIHLQKQFADVTLDHIGIDLFVSDFKHDSLKI